MRYGFTLYWLCGLSLVSCGDSAARKSTTAPTTRPRPRARPTASAAHKAFKDIVSRLKASAGTKKNVDLSLLFKGQIKSIPEGCGSKKARVTVYDMPTQLLTTAGNRPGAVFLVKPDAYAACSENDAQEPSVCALGVSPGGASKQPQLTLMELDLDFEESVIDKVHKVTWEERPSKHVMITMRVEASKPTCRGADSVLRESTDVMFVRYANGAFSTLVQLVEKSLVKDRGQELTTGSKWQWSTVHFTKDRTGVILAMANTASGADTPPSCKSWVTLYKFNTKADKMLELKGTLRKQLLENELMDFANASNEDCPDR